MTSFRFRLEKVLAWRRTQLELEEAKFQQRTREVQELERERARIEAAGIRAEVEVRGWSPLAGSDLAALANYRQYVAGQEKQMTLHREEAHQHAEAQQRAMIEARRRCQLLERLRERRLAEWRAEADKELEQLAAESYLAGRARHGF
jgi:flagellar export protein FliJ